MPRADEIERLLAAMSAVWRFAVHLCEVRHAETLVQETYLRAFRDTSGAPIADNQAALIYLFKVLHDVVRERESYFTSAAEPSLAAPTLLDQHALTRELRTDLDAHLQAAVCALPLPQRVVFLLSVVEKLRYGEISAIVGASRDEIAGRLSDARLAIAARLIVLPPPELELP